MTIEIKYDFDPHRVAESGQCFRWTRTGPRRWRVIRGADCLHITALGDGRWELDCTPSAFDAVWRDYLDLSEDYAAIRARIDPADAFLTAAAEREKGIRILRQDPWEALVSFILSQNKNIPAIRRAIEALAAVCGDARTDAAGEAYYAFPAPEALAALGAEALRRCGLGYRCAYVHAAAEAVCAGALDLDALRGADEARTMEALTGLFGVGVKVASCVSLFGLHHLNAFPRDVWVRRILAAEYPDGYPFAAYAPYNGVYQQYMFADYRHRNGGAK